MATAKKAAAVEEIEVEDTDDEIEALDEAVEGEEEAPKKRTRKAKVKKEEPEGLTTKEAGEILGIAPVKLRRILRTDDYFNDKGYTRYRLSDEDIERLRASIAAGTAEKKPRVKKTKAPKKSQAAAEEVSAELEESEDLADEEEEIADIDLEADDTAEEEDEELEDEDDE
jgi:hypothetical protein